jgi:hypothetical protein
MIAACNSEEEENLREKKKEKEHKEQEDLGYISDKSDDEYVTPLTAYIHTYVYIFHVIPLCNRFTEVEQDEYEDIV